MPVLGHRLILRPESRLRKVTAAKIVEEAVADVRVPLGRRPGRDEVEEPLR